MDALTATPAQIRAPRLTDRLLTGDLPRLIAAADDEIEYLDSRLACTGDMALPEKLRASFRERRDSLQRGRDWLAGKIAAESAHRTTEPESA